MDPKQPSYAISDLPPVKQLFTDSWQVFTKSVLRLLLIMVSSLCIYVGVGLLIGAVGFFTIGAAALGKLASGDVEALAALMTPQFFTTLGVLLFVYIVVLIIVSIFVYVAEILAVDRYNEPFSLGLVLSRGKAVFFPVIAMQFLVCFLTFGSFFVFVFPAMLIGFFLMFTSYEIIINTQGPVASLKRSTLIVTKHFGGILGRIILFWLLTVLVVQILPALVMRIDETAGAYFGFVSLVLNLLFTWYGICYSITLYKQARTGLEQDKGANILWMWIVAIIGWIIFACVAYGSYKLITSPKVQEMIAGMMSQNKKQVTQEKEIAYVPSSCGLKVPLPETRATVAGKNYQWTYEEIPVSLDRFYFLDKNAIPGALAQATYVGYGDTAKETLIDKDFVGFEIACVDNTKGVTLSSYKGLLLANKNIKATVKPVEGTEIMYLPATIESKNAEGKTVKENMIFLISEDGQKLITMRWFGPYGNDSQVKALQKDQQLILDNIQYGPTGNLPTPTLQPQRVQQTTYVAPTIKPGAPGSKEWQEDFDKKWNEMQQKNAASQQKMEQDQAAFCSRTGMC